MVASALSGALRVLCELSGLRKIVVWVDEEEVDENIYEVVVRSEVGQCGEDTQSSWNLIQRRVGHFH